MDKTRLAAKFKRAAEWKEYLASASPSEATKITLLKLLPRYEALLKTLWEASVIDPTHDAQIADLERQLESADEQARLFTSGR